MDFSVDIIHLVKYLKANRETIIANQIGRSGTSIGANSDNIASNRIIEKTAAKRKTMSIRA
ncbi:MAG: four helix bundle protein [Clostridia bacterium]|nr:four helix bundle protein [Clostridia bacterium]